MTLISTIEAAQMTNEKHQNIQKWCRSNNIKMVGGVYLMSMEDIEAFKNRNGRGWPMGKKRKAL